MKQSHVVTTRELVPYGMRCPYCKHVFEAGDEAVSVLEAVTDDGLPISLVMCPACAERSDEIVKCPSCDGTGGDEQTRCSRCEGAGDFIPAKNEKPHAS